MNRGKVFLWVAVGIAGVTFVGALAAAIPLASRMHALGGDETRTGDLLAQAREKLEAGDTAGARSLLDRILAADPGDPLARSDLARILKSEGDYAAAIAQDKIAIATAPDIPDLYYNVACYYALSKRKEEALAWLAAAFAHGFGRLDALRNDADLKSLAGDARFDVAARTGRFPDGRPRVRFHAAARKAKPNEPIELDLVVEREVPEADAARAQGALTVSFAPDAPVELMSSDVRTSEEPDDGVVTLRTQAKYVVRVPKEGVFALPPAKVRDGSRSVESEALEIEVDAEAGG